MRIQKTGKRVILTIATAAAVTMAMTVSPVLAAETSGIVKDETVYVVTSADGSQKEAIVSDHLENKKNQKTIKDASDLKQIENVKGDETFQYNEKHGTLTWNADGKDIYYQGKSDQKVPVALDITYHLNGKKVSGDEIQGKSGSLRIDINYKNNTEVPFVAMTGFVAENDCLSHVSISSGKVIDDGDKLFVAAMAMPGLADQFGITQQTELLTDHVRIKGEIKDFSCEDMMTVVTSDIFSEIDAEEFGDMDMDDQIDALNSGALKLVSGSETLYDGVHLLDQKSEQLAEGVEQLDSGAKQLDAGSRQSLEGSKKLAAGTSQLSQQLDTNLKALSAGAKKVAAGNEVLYGGLAAVQSSINGDNGLAAGAQKVASGAQDVVNGINQLAPGLDQAAQALSSGAAADQAALNELETVKETIGDEAYAKIAENIKASRDAQQQVAGSLKQDSSALSSGAQQVAAGAQAVSDGAKNLQTAFNGGGNYGAGLVASAKQLQDGSMQVSAGLAQATGDTNSLTSGAKELEAGADALMQGQSQLSSGAQELAEGMGQLHASTAPLVSGVNALDLGAKQLSKGMQELYSEGISKIVKLYQEDLKGMLEGLDSLTDAEKSYNSFTKLPAGMDGSVKFIYKTAVTDR